MFETCIADSHNRGRGLKTGPEPTVKRPKGPRSEHAKYGGKVAQRSMSAATIRAMLQY